MIITFIMIIITSKLKPKILGGALQPSPEGFYDRAMFPLCIMLPYAPERGSVLSVSKAQRVEHPHPSTGPL